MSGTDGKLEGVRAPITIEDLKRWEEHGATWRAVDLSDERAVVELCTCYGEAVDLRESGEPELIQFVRGQVAAGREPTGS